MTTTTRAIISTKWLLHRLALLDRVTADDPQVRIGIREVGPTADLIREILYLRGEEVPPVPPRGHYPRFPLEEVVKPQPPTEARVVHRADRDG